MADPTRAVRAHRFELLDDDDRLRAVLGPVGRHEGKTLYGLALYDEAGGERALLGVMPSGPLLSFVSGGDVALELGVADADGEQLDLGPYLVGLEGVG